MGQAASHALVAAADLQPPLAMGVSGLERELGEGAQHIRMLGSTRFMKTILCRLPNEGQLVLHVFMRPVSASFDLTQQIAELRAQYAKLDGAQRVLAHTRVISDDRAVYILRQYLHNNLYDRVSTRPFLSANEKRWIASQLLVALREAHERGVCHGDVKSENIVMTSWNLVYLADLAPFKPTYLPADDPAEFNFYFDAASRQCCCIAPERFYDPGSSIAQRLAAPSNGRGGGSGGDHSGLELQPSMDIFSAGCVIAELFLDGNPLFSLSRLLQYRKGDIAVSALVAAIPDSEVAELVQHMLQLDPAARLSAAEYLDRWTDIFPDAPLAAYMDRASADARMRALYEEMAEVPDDMCEITASVACANVRNCILPSSRSLGIRVLLRCNRGPMSGDLELILPYLVALTGDASPCVRAEAVVALRDLLLGLHQLAPININIFDDYLVPHLQAIAGDSSSMVRCMLASVLGDIADTSSFVMGSGGGARDQRSGILGGQMRAMVSKLSFDEAEVKHVLLCAFPQLYEHGLQSLSHIITYLNDRDCWFLRAAFFDVVFAAAAQISRQASREYIVPLINLGDSELFVVVSALRALIRLVPQMSPAMLWDKLVEVQAFCTTPALRRSASEFTEFVLANATLPLATDTARLALDVMRIAQARADDEPATAYGQDVAVAVAAPEPVSERLVQLREVGAALRTVFLTPVADPWAPEPQTGGTGTSAVPGSTRAADAFLRKKSLELAFPATARKQKLDGWRPRGTLAAEVAEHNDAVTCVVAAKGSLFVTGSDDGTVRVFDGGVVRKTAVCRSRAKSFQGGRITGLVYHEAVDCLASSSDNGTIHVLRASADAGSGEGSLKSLATTTLPAGEHAVALGLAKNAEGAVLVASTSRSRVLFFGIVDLQLQEALVLPPTLGRPTCMASDGATLAVVGTAEGNLQLVDTRFRIELTTHRHFLGHRITALSMYTADSVLVGTAPGDVCVLSLRTGRWPVCVCSRSLQELKGNEINRRLRVNCLVHVPGAAYFITGSNDGMVRFWDPEDLDRSYAVNSSEAAPPYSSYRLNDTVYYCENAAASMPRSPASPGRPRLPGDSATATNSSHPGGPITAMAILAAPAPMLVTGLQGGAIRVLL
ncbi:Serine/threonine-protein kinase [Coemansia biformis]|uniref:non-specific serine/threonine protein kinase n=1 Tax=Coemansia biformis TaxID=1286918 RepID=A0A9W8CXX1_9FUNG|nr:Serine/threonine-protein kinase [Coemansia biformis]